jgi:UDP-N-acetyl-D-mannosaminuronic acid transferase (WecB/TagA/CpsF family)
MYNQGIAPLAHSHPFKGMLAVRLGKVLLQSVDVDELFVSSYELKHIVTVNSEIFVYAHENAAYEAILKRTVNTIDGRILHFLCSLLYPGRGLKKLSGSDFIYNLAAYATRRRERVFLLGADVRSNHGAIEALKARCCGLIVDGYSPSFCSNIQEQEWNEDILSRIASFRPAHLVVCFGPVKQEMWISHNADRLFRFGVQCAYGLGGTLDFGFKRLAQNGCFDFFQSQGKGSGEPRGCSRCRISHSGFITAKSKCQELRRPRNQLSNAHAMSRSASSREFI